MSFRLSKDQRQKFPLFSNQKKNRSTSHIWGISPHQLEKPAKKKRESQQNDLSPARRRRRRRLAPR